MRKQGILSVLVASVAKAQQTEACRPLLRHKGSISINLQAGIGLVEATDERANDPNKIKYFAFALGGHPRGSGRFDLNRATAESPAKDRDA